MTDQHLTGCHGILWHEDTQWHRCPKASECMRYRQRYRLADPVYKLCRTVEFEHFLPANGR
jgi:hypothetical protein